MNKAAARCWLLLAVVDNTVLVEVVSTDHPEGPRGHVPERCASSVRESDAWLVDRAFGVTGEIEHVEVRDLGLTWSPTPWI